MATPEETYIPAARRSLRRATAEFGIVETQDSKRVTINGRVLVNSDVDADVWGPPNKAAKCPDVNGAAAIV